MSSRASAPGKIILFGEHFVVHGSPAILAAIDKRITVIARTTDVERTTIKSDMGAAGQYTSSGFKPLGGGKTAKAILDPLHSAVRQVLASRKQKAGIALDISSEIPHGIGLGSSAASCVATVAAIDSLFGHKVDRQWICKKAIESERLIHGSSSGADCYVSAFGGLVNYCKSVGLRKLESKYALPIVIGSTGIKRYTGDLVAGVRKFKGRNELLFANLAAQAGDICSQAWAAIEAGKHEKLGLLMNENQALLRQIGVSHEKADDLIALCMKGGALGAKMTGAGGGGAVIALASSKLAGSKISSRIREANYDSLEVSIDRKGLVVA
jgi:mevalonate kinase